MSAESLAERTREQVVVAIPASLVVERDDEQVLTLGTLEHLLPIGASGDRVAYSGGQAIEYRRFLQKGLHWVRLVLQNVFDQVVDDVAMAPRECGDERVDVRPSAHRQRRQLQSG